MSDMLLKNRPVSSKVSGARPVKSFPPGSDLSFSVLRRVSKIDWPLGRGPVPLEPALALALLKMLPEKVAFDEVWYLSAYPDVKKEIDSGAFVDARQHYLQFGYFEDRLPRLVKVNETYYRSAHPDVAAGVESGWIISYQWHFEQHGFREGRLPESGWTLLS